MFSFENVSRNKEIFKFTAGLEADHCHAVFEFLDKGTCCENINFYNGQHNKTPKSNPQDVKTEKKQSS